MGFHCLAVAHKPKITVSGAGSCDVKHIVSGSSGNVSTEVMNHVSLSASLMNESEFIDCQENTSYCNAQQLK